jgi:hypothetical protein
MVCSFASGIAGEETTAPALALCSVPVISQAPAWIPRADRSQTSDCQVVIFDEMKSTDEQLAQLDKWTLSTVKNKAKDSRRRPCGSLEVYSSTLAFSKASSQGWLAVECMRQHLKRRVKRFVPPCHPPGERFSQHHSTRARLRSSSLPDMQRSIYQEEC